MRRLLLLFLSSIVIATSSHDVPQTVAVTTSDQSNVALIRTEASAPVLATQQTNVINSDEIGICLSRTANYVTHTLPQQCLRTDWSRSRSELSLPSLISSVSSETTLSSTAPVVESSIDERPATTSSNLEATSAPTATVTAETEATIEPQQSQGSYDVQSISDEADSPLDTAHFLSFEDWKRQNLAKVGQSSDNLGPRAPIEAGRKAPIANALDSFGDENEIDIDFAGFGSSTAVPTLDHEPPKEAASSSLDATSTAASSALQALRPRDAGRTCKERTNYASFDCAATVLKSNPECKSASSVLVENKDSYMLNKCSAKNKFFIVELCNDILIDTIVLANYEFFSSIFRQFRVSVSDRYPVKAEKWKDLGTFEASNTREVQAFLVENPLIWARYLRIEFLTHYGSEYYCPVSLLRVHGTTMMEEFRNQEELARGEVDGQEEDEAIVTPTKDVEVDTQSMLTTAELKETAVIDLNLLQSSIAIAETNATTLIDQGTNSTASSNSSRAVRAATSAVSLIVPVFHTTSTCPLAMTTAMTTVLTLTKVSEARISTQVSSTTAPNGIMLAMSSDITVSTNTTSQSSSDMVASSATSSSSASVDVSLISTSIETASSNSSNNISSTSKSSPRTSIATQSVTSSSKDTSSRSGSPSSSKTVSFSSNAPPAQPSTQESFFKSISKRLQQLESNSTLGLQYIEEQSRILRDAFGKVEKRQINMTSSFLSNLNKTVMTELAGFRQAYDQLWQSTVIELEGQRQQHKVEMTALSSRLTLAVDELVWQKRMGIVQSTLLLLCLALVLFGRGSTGPSDVSLMQHVMLRSQTAFRSGTGSEANSPVGSRSPVSLFRRKIPLWGGESRWKDSEVQSMTVSNDDSPTEHELEEELEEDPLDDRPSDGADIEGTDAQVDEA